MHNCQLRGEDASKYSTGFLNGKSEIQIQAVQTPHGTSGYQVLTLQAQWELFLSHETAELRSSSARLASAPAGQWLGSALVADVLLQSC